MPWNLYPAGIITIQSITSVVCSASICTVLLFCSNLIKFRKKKKKKHKLYIRLFNSICMFIAVDEVEMSVAESAAEQLLSFTFVNCVDTNLWGVFCLKSSTLSPVMLPTHQKLHSMPVCCIIASVFGLYRGPWCFNATIRTNNNKKKLITIQLPNWLSGEHGKCVFQKKWITVFPAS